MAEKKSNRLKDILPHVILVFVLVSTVLILVDVAGNLISENFLQGEQPSIINTPSKTPGQDIPVGPTPTLPPIQDA